jgi:hypothetical protein
MPPVAVHVKLPSPIAASGAVAADGASVLATVVSPGAVSTVTAEASVTASQPSASTYSDDLEPDFDDASDATPRGVVHDGDAAVGDAAVGDAAVGDAAVGDDAVPPPAQYSGVVVGTLDASYGAIDSDAFAPFASAVEPDATVGGDSSAPSYSDDLESASSDAAAVDEAALLAPTPSQSSSVARVETDVSNGAATGAVADLSVPPTVDVVAAAQPRLTSGSVVVTVERAWELADRDLLGRQDPYVKVSVEGQTSPRSRGHTAAVTRGGTDVTFDAAHGNALTLWYHDVDVAAPLTLVVEVLDKDVGSKDDVIGCGTVVVDAAGHSPRGRQYVCELRDGTLKPSGKVSITAAVSSPSPSAGVGVAVAGVVDGGGASGDSSAPPRSVDVDVESSESAVSRRLVTCTRSCMCGV